MGTTVNVTLAVELDAEFFSDIITTSIESGYGSVYYWDSLHRVHREWDNAELDILDRTALALVVTHQENLPGCVTETVRIDHGMIAQVLGNILSGKVEVAPHIREYIDTAVREKDAGNIDADAADVIMQIATFGSIVYG